MAMVDISGDASDVMTSNDEQAEKAIALLSSIHVRLGASYSRPGQVNAGAGMTMDLG